MYNIGNTYVYILVSTSISMEQTYIIEERKNKNYLIGYRANGIELYKKPLRPLGYVVVGLGFASLAVAVVPNGLGIIFYPLGFSLLSIVGVNTLKLEKNIKTKVRFNIWRLRNNG